MMEHADRSVRKNGTKSIAAATMERWFTASFRTASRKQSRIQNTLANTNSEGYNSLLRSAP